MRVLSELAPAATNSSSCTHKAAALQISTGAQNDLEKITQMAYSSVAVYGMNAKVGLVSFPPNSNQLHKPYSDETAQLIDTEARDIINGCYETTLALLREKRDLVEALAQVCRVTSLCWHAFHLCMLCRELLRARRVWRRAVRCGVQ